MNSAIETTIIDILKDYDPLKIAIFGSFARNEQSQDSDIDILVEFGTTLTLLQLANIERKLSQKLGFRVDLVTPGAIKHPIIKNSINKDLKIIYQ